MVDYRRFLAAPETVVAPWLGGPTVALPERRLRLAAAPERPGWYALEVKGRVATVKGPAAPPDLSALPAVRGWLWKDRLVLEGARAERLHLVPDDEPPQLSPVTARRWAGEALLFEQLDFESEAEGALREALAQGRGIATVKGVAAPLRAAYGFALLERESRRLGIPAAAAELRPHVGRVAELGAEEAERVLRALVAERELALRELAELARQRAAALAREELVALREARAAQARRQQETADERAAEALAKAGATLESSRRAGEGRLEVVFGFMHERFVALVDQVTLQVLDSGICLGHPPRDELVTLDSLPGVIQEAIETDALVILRHP